MTSVLLIYPFFIPARDRSIFRFPPLGLSYIAANLLQAGHAVQILDGTFLKRTEALTLAMASGAEVVGIYCMVTLTEDCLWFARNFRDHCKLLIAGGPLPTCDPVPFMEHFDVVVLGEGEETMKDLLSAYEESSDFSSVPGIAYRKKTLSPGVDEAGIAFSAARPVENALDTIPFPARTLLPNDRYIAYGKKKYGYAITTIMSTRGCPYRCEFCSNVVFGGSYRQRSPENIVDEIVATLDIGYDRISFSDDVFTMNRRHVLGVCEEIERRQLKFSWECLGRVDAIDYATAARMKQAGCTRIYFGIESANDRILELMRKGITAEQARSAVEAAHRAGLEAGAFFILFYPGETIEEVIHTLHFATSLPLDYLGLSMPYPLPGTALKERVRNQITREWRSGENVFGSHVLIFDSDFSAIRMWLGILKGHAQFKIKRFSEAKFPSLLRFFEQSTDWLLRKIK